MTFHIIRDWAGNWLAFDGRDRFPSWDDAEEFLSERLGDQYETDRGEYYIEEFTAEPRPARYLDPKDPRASLRYHVTGAIERGEKRAIAAVVRKPTIYEALKAKLGREPSHEELKQEVLRILREARAGGAA